MTPIWFAYFTAACIAILMLMIHSDRRTFRRTTREFNERLEALESQAAQPVTVELTPMDDPPREVLHMHRGVYREGRD